MKTTAPHSSLAIGLALILLALWKGPPDDGLTDLTEYVVYTENIWLHGRLAEPGRTLDSRYPIGQALFCMPLVYLGVFLESTCGISKREIIALIVPLLALASACLALRLARLLSFDWVPAIAAVVLLVAGSQFIVYTRVFYYDVGVFFGITLALWARYRFLYGDPALRERNALLTGFGLACITLFHYGSVATSAGLYLGFAGVSLLASQPFKTKLREISLLTLCPLLGAALILAVNYGLNGSFFKTAYHGYYDSKSGMFVSDFVLKNLYWMAWWWIRNPWFLVAIAATMYYFRSHRTFTVAILLAVGFQHLLWLFFRDFSICYYRYPMPMLALAWPGLFALTHLLYSKWGTKGLAYASIPIFMFNGFHFIRGEDLWPSFLINENWGPDVLCHVWYMEPYLAGQRRHYGSTVGPVQVAVLLILLSGGIAFLVRAFYLGWKLDTEAAQAPVAQDC